jgi:hypothetical protein
VWKAELHARAALVPGGKAYITLQHAGDDVEERIDGGVEALIERLLALCGGREQASFLNMPYQPLVGDGMLRVYMVRDRPIALLHQLPKPGGLNVSRSGLCQTEGLPKGERYYRAGHPLFDQLATELTTQWLPKMRSTLGIEQLPVIWDADFLFRGSATEHEGGGCRPAEESDFVLCEINCSCVFPGEPLLPLVAQEVKRWLQ